jgi:hypothetical protein
MNDHKVERWNLEIWTQILIIYLDDEGRRFEFRGRNSFKDGRL